MSISEVYNIDCLEYMKSLPDNYFQLSICDPPYFDECKKETWPGSEVSTTGIKRNRYSSEHWEIPSLDYFMQLDRISINMIIWGINYFDSCFTGVLPSTGRIIWDKKNDKSSFSKAEIAYCSLHKSVQMFRYCWNGMIQEDMKNKEPRIHPTQKPVALYKWLLNNYAKEGDKIFDSHLGSQSSRIAAYQLGFDFWGCELDEDYFKQGCDRFVKETSQIQLFNC